MNFSKLAVTVYETGTTRPAPGADDVWVNLDQVVSIVEHLGSNTFDEAVRADRIPVEHYPCLLLTMSSGHTHLVPLGTYPDQASGFDALTRFVPTLTNFSGDATPEFGCPTYGHPCNR